MTVSREELRTARVGLNWEVRERHHTTMSLHDLLVMVDGNEESWTNEDGSPRFATVEDALEWVSSQPGPMDDSMFVDHLYETSGSRTWTDGDVDGFGIDVDLLATESAAEAASDG